MSDCEKAELLTSCYARREFFDLKLQYFLVLSIFEYNPKGKTNNKFINILFLTISIHDIVPSSKRK